MKWILGVSSDVWDIFKIVSLWIVYPGVSYICANIKKTRLKYLLVWIKESLSPLWSSVCVGYIRSSPSPYPQGNPLGSKVRNDQWEMVVDQELSSQNAQFPHSRGSTDPEWRLTNGAGQICINRDQRWGDGRGTIRQMPLTVVGGLKHFTRTSPALFCSDTSLTTFAQFCWLTMTANLK